MKTILLIIFVACFSSLVLAQGAPESFQNFPNDVQTKKSNICLNSQIEKNMSGFPCAEKEVTSDFAGRYEKFSGNLPWWLSEKKCDDQQAMCPTLFRVNREQIECRIQYRIPANSYTKEHLVTRFNFPPADNLEIIHQKVESLKNSGRKIIFVTQSKGGLDLANFLLSYPDYWNIEDALIQGWIPLQIPFWGTTVSQKVLDSWFLRKAANATEEKYELSSEFTEMLSPHKCPA